MLSFASPWVFLLLPLPLLMWRFAPPYKERTAALRVPFFRQIATATQSDISTGAHVLSRNKIQMITAVLCWILLVTGLARPERLGEPITVTEAARDMVLAVDISGSMDDLDMLAPDGSRVQRLQAVKDVLSDFIEDREGDRISLIVFGTKAYVQSPFTLDLAGVTEFLNQTQVGMAGPDTAIGDAIGLSIRTFENSNVEQRLLILLSDGADTGSMMSPVNAAEIAAQEGVSIYTIGFGDPEGQGEERIDLAMLENIAKRADGEFYFADNVEGLAQIYREIDTQNPRITDTTTYQPREPISHIPFLTALALALAATTWLHVIQSRGAA